MGRSLGEHTFACQLAPLRADPADGAEQVTQALAGEPLRVLEERGQWVRVETEYAYPGWVRREYLGGEPDPDWLRPVTEDPIGYARTLLGTRYEWGGMTAAGIDCSGLVHMAIRACGRLVPRDADQQEEAADRLPETDFRPGDLITYGPPEKADHIAFWVGGGRILHATARDGVNRVVEEDEPAELRERRRALVRLGTIAAGLSLLLLAAGCGGSRQAATSGYRDSVPPPTAAPAPKEAPAPAQQFAEFRIAMDEALDYLDPGLSDTTEGWGVMWNVYLPLLGYRHANGRSGATLVPYLATSLPQISRDKRTYRLTLRKGLRYSDGSPVEASDFKKTIERDFLLDSAGAAFFRNIVGAERFAKRQKGRIRGIVVDDSTRTILIHLVNPQADFANALASQFAAPVPADAPPTDTSLNPLPSTGPYEITSYQPKGRIVAKRNRYFQAWRFHGDVPAGNPDRITWDIVPSAGVALRRVLQGKDDWMGYYQIPSKRLPAIERKYAERLRTFMPPNLMYFFMNTRVPPFNSVQVRRAVNYAISRRWLKHLAGGLARPTENILPLPYAPAFQAHTLYRYDLGKAIRLVRTSGYRGKRVFVWNHDVAADRPYTKYLVSVLQRIGFNASEKVVTAGSYWTTIGDEKTRAQIGFADFVQDYPHPLDWFGLLDGRRITQTHNSNYANFDVGWANRAIDTLTRQPKLTPEVERAWAALDRRVMRLAPWAPFLNEEQTDFFSSRVDLGCYVNNVLYEFDYATICVKK
jgi:peptide/nickel transport system substrate-binding protein